VIIAFASFGRPSSLFAQASPPLVENISLKEGLKQATIHSIVQIQKADLMSGSRAVSEHHPRFQRADLMSG